MRKRIVRERKNRIGRILVSQDKTEKRTKPTPSLL